MMKPRERVMRALDHREPDRVPIDLGSSVTSLHVVTSRKLREALGYAGQEEIIDPMQQLVRPDERILERFHVDTRHVSFRPARPWVEVGHQLYEDEWGIRYRMPEGGYYYDIVSSPLRNATYEDLARYPWPDPRDPRRLQGLKEEVLRIYEHTDYAVVLGGYGAILLDLASWLRGHEQFYVDLVLDPKFAHELLDRLLEFYLVVTERVLKEIGKYIHVIRFSMDLGTQEGLLISLQLFRKFIGPRLKRLLDFVRERTDAKIFLHSCGSVYDLIVDLIEAGVDVLNPLQPTAKNMGDSRKLKAEFGDRLCFWGGIDVQNVLPYGTTDDVREEVRRRITALAPGGGYVFAPGHNLQPDVPPVNICTLFDTALELGRYAVSSAL